MKRLIKSKKNSVFGALVIGASGSGKSTLINNLVGKYVVEEAYTLNSETNTIVANTTALEGVPVTLYDTPGLGHSHMDDDVICQMVKDVLESGRIHLVICCMNMSETRIRSSLIHMFQEYTKLGVNWEKSIIALTFADYVPIFSEMKKLEVDMNCYFDDCLAAKHADIIRMLVERVGVIPEVAKRIKCIPITSDSNQRLLNGKYWFGLFYLNVLEILSPDVAMRFLQEHTNKVECSSAEMVMSASTALPTVTPGIIIPTSRLSVSSKAVAPPRTPGCITLRGLTESECHTLYQEAITSGPTITLHIAKAMTIGPPRAGKTSLRHLLLELPLPEVSISTPVMKTAETVGILAPDDTTSSGGNELSRAVKADSDLIQIGNEDKWVIVSETSGILSILSHLIERGERAKLAQIQKDASCQMQSLMKYTHSEQALKEVKPQAQLPSIHADSKQAGSQLEVGKQPIPDASTGATTEDSSRISAVASELHQLLRTPDIINVTLPDAKLLQFLDCGGQLAFHDIIPIFTTIPAIYLHVFDLTRDLTTYPEDQLCLEAEDEVYSHVQSPLTVAQMMYRSAMTIESLADKNVQLPEGVLLSEPPESRIAFVGTHLDELTQTSENIKSTFDSTSKALQSVLQLESQTLEEMVMKNQDDRLPAMFFPVTCKQSVVSDIGSRAIKELKKRIRALVGDVKVKVPVKWYLYQMMEISHSKKKHTPVQEYGKLYKSCFLAQFVNDLKEFHTMITYFHALGLLIHVCNDDAATHHEDSTCLVFTHPSYLFENISKLFHVQFMDEIRCEGSLLKLKREGRLTLRTLRDLKVDNTQLSYEAFMNVLMHFFIGAKIEDSAGNEDCTLFIPSALPFNNTSICMPVTTEQSCHLVIAFSKKPFVPCGVYAGVIARLQSLPQWTVSTSSISRSHACFGVGAKDNVELVNYSSHIQIVLRAYTGLKVQEYRDTVLTAVAKSYCFLFHGKRTKDQPCATCRDNPYLMLGLVCHPCRETRTRHIATLQVVDGEAKAVRCMATQDSGELPVNHLELFQGIQHDVSVYMYTSHDRARVMLSLHVYSNNFSFN